MPITPDMSHAADAPRLASRNADSDRQVLRAAELLPPEDIAVIESFLIKPTAGMDDVQLAARTLLPLSIVDDRVKRLVGVGLLSQTLAKNGRTIYKLGSGPRDGRWRHARGAR